MSPRKSRKPATTPTSFRAFARSLGVDEKAVRKGVASGRIPPATIGRTARGQPTIVDPEAARAAWFANAAQATKGESESGTLVAVQRQVAEQRARRLLFENDLRSGLYVPVHEAKREAFEAARVIREGLLNLPARLAAELAAESDPQRVYAILDDQIRAALGETADALEHAS